MPWTWPTCTGPSQRRRPTLAEHAGALIRRERDRTAARLGFLRRAFDDIVAVAAADPPDDEHDPEGATIAFERQQLATFIADATRHLDDLDAASARVAAGTFGVCESCARHIAAARLQARPTALRCVGCA